MKEHEEIPKKQPLAYRQRSQSREGMPVFVPPLPLKKRGLKFPGMNILNLQLSPVDIRGDFTILGDPAPGDVSKVCECEVLDSSAAAAEESMTWVPVKQLSGGECGGGFVKGSYFEVDQW